MNTIDQVNMAIARAIERGGLLVNLNISRSNLTFGNNNTSEFRQIENRQTGIDPEREQGRITEQEIRELEYRHNCNGRGWSGGAEMEIVAIMMFICGAWIFSWYKSGEIKPGDPGDTLPAKRGELVRITRIESIHPDGLTGDLDLSGPAWATCGIRIRMNGAKIPQGRNPAEKWLADILRGQLAEIIGAAKLIQVGGITRELDGSLSADLHIDGRQLAPKKYEPPPDEPTPVRRQEQPSFQGGGGFPSPVAGYPGQGAFQGYPQGLNRPQSYPSFQGGGYPQGGGL